MSRLLSACSAGARQDGISALEILVIVVIVAVVAALGIPMLHSRSREALLDANMRSLASTVQELLLEGLDSAYHAAGDGSADAYISTNLETMLRESAGKARYANPYAGRTTSRTIINSSSLTTDSTTASPAVLVTDNPDCRYDVFNAQLDQAMRRQLAGAIVVQFNAPGGTLDVFYVDGAGNRSARVVRLPLA